MNEHIVKSYGEELDHLTAEVARLGGLAEAAVAEAIDAIARRDLAIANNVIGRDERLDTLQIDIEKKSIRLIALRQLGNRLGHDAGIQLFVFGIDANGFVRAHGQCRAKLRRHIRRTERSDRHLTLSRCLVCTIFRQTKSCLDRVFVKLVELPVRAAQVEGVVLELEFLGWIRNPLGGDENLHGHSLVG